jgi:TetR/AcrR family transcriptional regulator, transcriptional repressor for nem operon
MADTEARLTQRGSVTRERIVEAAAGIVLDHGVAGTTNDLVRRAAAVSGSQLTHYFPDKESLVSAVIAWRAQSVMNLTVLAARGGLDTFDGIRAWVDSYLSREEVCVAGCSFGSIAGEVMKTQAATRAQFAAGFDQWEALFRAGFESMRERGELKPGVAPVAMANVLMAAFQGGMLLSQAAGDAAPLKDALNGALAYLMSLRV